MSTNPPRLAEALVGRLLGECAWRDTTLGDLREEFETMRARRGRLWAAAWYWRQSAAIAIDAWRSRRTLPSSPKDGPVRSLLSEFRLAAKSLRRQPLVNAVVILTLALGLGANAATFGMIDSLLLRPFTIPTVDRLVVLAENSPDEPFAQEAVSPANYADLRRERGALRRITAIQGGDVNLAGADQPVRAQGSSVGAEFFDMLGVAPADGRFFLTDDEVHGRHRVAVISDGVWKRRFGSASGIVGQVIRLDGEPYTVVGRAPAGFDFPSGTEIWTPLAFSASDAAVRSSRYLTVVGELAPGQTIETAQAQMSVAYERLKQYPENRVYALVVRTFTTAMVDFGMPRVLALWQTAAVLLLLIGGTNIANLLLARGAERQRELAVRLAIGAGRGRLIRQLLVESVVLGLVAVPAALLMAGLSFMTIKSRMPATLLRYIAGWDAMGVTPRVILFTVVAALGTAVLFGLLPAIRSSRPSLTSSLKDGRSSTAGIGRSRLRRALVVAEVALALPLLLASGLAAIGSQRFASGPQGYDPDGVVRMRTELPEVTYPDAAARRQFVERLLAEAAKVPGVERVATTTITPAISSNTRRHLVVDGRPVDPERPWMVNYRAISAGYHDTLRIPIIEGRSVEPHDRHETERVAVVSQSLVRQSWPGGSAIGRRVKFGPDSVEWMTVVGVVGDTVDDWFDSRRAPTIFVPVQQIPSVRVTLVARSSGDPAVIISGLREALARVDPTQPEYDARTMRDAIHERTTGLRFIGQLMAAFGILALVLAAGGIYSVMAHYVAQRRHEIGVRMALGASSLNVLQLTVGQGAKLAALGIVIGLGFGVALARLMESALFGVVAVEPALFGAIAGILALVAITATLLPARHAMRIEPARALRE